MDIERPTDAVEGLEAALRHTPNDVHLVHRWAAALQADHHLRATWLGLRRLVDQVDDPALRRALVGVYERHGLWDQALAEVDRFAEPTPEELEAAARVAARGGSADAGSRARAALAAAPDHAARARCIRWLLASGDAARAARQADGLLAEAPDDPAVRVFAATLALWRGEVDRARELERGLTGDAAERLRCALALAEGDAAEAERRSVADPDDPERLLLGALALARTRRWDQARTRAEAALNLPHTSPWARPITLLARGSRTGALEWRELCSQLGPRLGGRRRRLLADLAGRDLPGAALLRTAVGRQVLRDLPARIGWNLSELPTEREPTWAPIALPEDSRTASIRAFDLLQVLELDPLVAWFDALIARFPESPFPQTHRAELYLWFGRYAEAEADSRRAVALDPVVGRFGWVALGLALTLQGRYHEAITLLDRAEPLARFPPGSSVPAIRGECRWRLGDLDGAEAELVEALQESPSRVGSRVVLGLVRGARNAAALEDTWGRLAAAFPQVVRHLDPCPVDLAQRLEAVLGMLRGNRSSRRLTWFGPDARPRITEARPF